MMGALYGTVVENTTTRRADYEIEGAKFLVALQQAISEAHPPSWTARLIMRVKNFFGNLVPIAKASGVSPEGGSLLAPDTEPVILRVAGEGATFQANVPAGAFISRRNGQAFTFKDKTGQMVPGLLSATIKRTQDDGFKLWFTAADLVLVSVVSDGTATVEMRIPARGGMVGWKRSVPSGSRTNTPSSTSV
jgi:hypothetical protein